MHNFNDLSISKKISLSVILILTITLSMYLVVFFVKSDSSTLSNLEGKNEEVSSLLIESIRLAMSAGVDDTTPFIKSFEKSEMISEVRITPTNLIKHNSEISLDEIEKNVLSTKEEVSLYEKFNESDVLRSIKLIKADNSCVDCHEANVGDVLAVVSIKQSLEKAYVEMASQKIDAAWIGGLAALATFFLTFYFVNKNLGKPILKLTLAAKKISDGIYDDELDCKSKDELGILARTFNEMAEKIDMQLQYLNKLPIPVIVMDTEFKINYINNKVAELLNKKNEEIIGTKCYDNFKTKDCNTENCACALALSTNQIHTRENIAKPIDKEVPILYSGAPLKNRAGEIIGILETVTDITNAKEKEAYLERSANEILDKMKKLADGDLTVSLSPENEEDTIGELFNGFNSTVKAIRIMIDNISDAISATASASVEISASSEQMAAGAQEQSSQSNEIASAIEQMTRTIIDTAQNVGLVADSSKVAGELASEGKIIVDKTINGMEKISDVVAETAKTVETLGKGSEKIGNIIKVINEIAEQTNLLALNAAIEAARAGEHGRGFAVVADEVRKLAERTTGATTEISDMINAIQSNTKGAVESIYSGTEEVKKGMTLVEKAGESLVKINESTMHVIDLISQVATASEEQSATSEQISKSIDGISHVTQESAAGVTQIANTADDLNRLTENLKVMIQKFKIDSRIKNKNSNDFILNKEQVYKERA